MTSSSVLCLCLLYSSVCFRNVRVLACAGALKKNLKNNINKTPIFILELVLTSKGGRVNWRPFLGFPGSAHSGKSASFYGCGEKRG